jgi:tetratricopeptide (TPR) repeat protein
VLRVRTPFVLAGGLALAGFCGFAGWWSVRVAVADWEASAGTIDGFRQAIELAPNDPQLRAREALFRNESEDPSPEVDEELRLAARLNPYDSAVLMTIGLREEFRGNVSGAETWLERAAAIDHQFKPAWTLANFYYRTQRPEKSWRSIQRILNLDPLRFDPAPVFELAWNELGGDEPGEEVGAARKILKMIPASDERPLQFLQFLVRKKKVAAAMEAWPEALATVRPGDVEETAEVTELADLLAAKPDRAADAVMVWNQLVAHGILEAKSLNPAKGSSIGDPEFQFPAIGSAFGWRVTEAPGVFVNKFAGSLRMEINGEEPETFQVLSVIAPVLSATHYRLRWKVDGSELKSPRDPGFAFQVAADEAGGASAPCGPLLARGEGECDFVSSGKAGNLGIVRLNLRYARAPGTTRISGVMQILSVHLEPGI